MSKFLTIAKKWMPVVVIVILFMPLLVSAAPFGRSGLDENQIIKAITNLVEFLILISFIVAVVYIVVAGFRYMFAGGDPETAGKARTMLWNGLIGLIIVGGAYVIANTVLTIVAKWLGR